MPSLSNNPAVLEGLYLLALAKAFLRHRNPRRREARGHRAAFYERAWRDAVEELGADWRALGPKVWEVSLGDVRTRIVDSLCAIDDRVTHTILLDKPLTHRILASAGLPVPRHAAFSLKRQAAALGLLRELAAEPTGKDAVVKPADGGGGAGVTTGVRTAWQLARAAAEAAVYGDELMIEEQIPGDNYRLLYLDGELIDAFVRKPPAVVGDGKSTVARLLRAQNDERLRSKAGMSQALLAADLDMRRTLAGQGLSLRSVPAAGRWVVLKTVVNDNCGRDNSTATHLLCPAIVEAGTRAVTALGARFAGVDVITTDPAVPLEQSGGVILEVNAPPNLYFHYHKADGCFPAAVPVLRRLLEGAARQCRASDGAAHVDLFGRQPEAVLT